MSAGTDAMPALARRTGAVAAAGILALVAFTARSAAADATDSAAAEAIFRQARAAVSAGDYASACPLFQESLRLDPAPGTLLNLADCEEHTGRLASAWEHFERLEKRVAPSDERFEVAHARRDALALRVPHLVVRLSPGSPAATRVFRDEVALGPPTMGLPLPVDPGHHVVTVLAPGHAPQRIQVDAREGENAEVIASVGPPVRTSVTRTGGWILGALGVAALASGGSFGFLALEERQSSDAHCANGVCSDAASLRDYGQARTDARIADVMLGVGVVAVVVSGVLLLTSKPTETLGTGSALASNGRFGLSW